MRVTIEEVATRAGVSPTAVSMVVNRKHLRHVRKEARLKIVEAIRELDYHPHASGRSLALKKTYTIGVLLYEINYIRQAYFAAVIGGMEEIMGDHDYNLQFATTMKSPKTHSQNSYFMRKIKEKRVDGVIILDDTLGDEEILTLRDMGVPFVLINRRIEGEDLHSVGVDNRAGMAMAVKHLLDLGHSRIWFLAGSGSYKSTEMVDGYREVLGRNGIEVNKNLVKSVSSIERLREMVSELAASNDGSTGLVTVSDILAIEFIRAAKEKGLTVPGDVAVVGFDDIRESSLITPSLTTVRVPLDEMGKQAVEMLVEILRGEEVDHRDVTLPTELIVRESSGARAWEVL